MKRERRPEDWLPLLLAAQRFCNPSFGCVMYCVSLSWPPASSIMGKLGVVLRRATAWSSSYVRDLVKGRSRPCASSVEAFPISVSWKDQPAS